MLAGSSAGSRLDLGTMNVDVACKFSWDPIYLHVFAENQMSILHVNLRGILSIYMFLHRTEQVFCM